MSKFTATHTLPTFIQGDRYGANGTASQATGPRRIATAYNSVSSAHRKLLYVRASQSPATPASTNEPNHYFCFRTGENVGTVTAWIGMQASAITSGTNQAYCMLQLFNGTGTLSSPAAYLPTVQTSASEITWHRISINTADTSLAANTEYRGLIRQHHYARVHSVMVFETASAVTDSSVDGVCDPSSWELHKPIYDNSVQDLAETGTTLWQHNACQLLNWGRKSLATAPEVIGTTEVNLLDTSITGGTWSATTPGFVLNTEYHDTLSGDVPVVLGVYAARTAGTGDLTVRIKRNGSTIVTGTIGTAMTPFDSSTHTITARASDKVDITLAAASGATWKVYGVGLWEYEA